MQEFFTLKCRKDLSKFSLRLSVSAISNFLISNQVHQDPIRRKLLQINDLMLYFPEHQIMK